MRPLALDFKEWEYETLGVLKIYLLLSNGALRNVISLYVHSIVTDFSWNAYRL